MLSFETFFNDDTELEYSSRGRFMLPHCLVLQCNFLCCNVLFSGVLGSGLCLQNQALYCVSCAAVIVSLAGNINVLFLSSFSIKEKFRLLF